VQLLADFRRHYRDPALYESPRYRTRDGVIPFGAFWIFYRRIPSHLALERVNMMRAVLNAISVAFGKEGSGLPESVRRDLKEARLEGSS
jgi:hypothetical protein